MGVCPFGNQWLKDNGLPVKKDQSVTGAVIRVLAKNDPYAVTDDMKEDGIESHFVVSSVFLILTEIDNQGLGQTGARHIVERALKIGGDPDTICSIAMSLYGLHYPDMAKFTLSQIHLPVR